MAIEDLCEGTAAKMTALLDRHPVRYADVEREIRTAIRVLESLKELIELGRPRPRVRDILRAQRATQRIENAVAVMHRDR